MSYEERCEIVLQAKEPERALRALVLELVKEGRSQPELYGSGKLGWDAAASGRL